ncbi:MAG: TnsA endonuclease N-terminal domain-containing protein [Acidobacteria bacterium]|nr:TnsA endonuclease N-terminal domain-containing protein [Acidobacteriota bacterium]
MQASIWWESPLERDYIFLLEIDPSVTRFQEQPLHIYYTLDGQQRHRYTPDFLVERGSQKQIVEVKTAAEAKTEEFDRIFRTVAPVCSQSGYEFALARDTEIRLQPRLYNVQVLWRYARTQFLPQHQIYCRHALRSGPITLGELTRYFDSKRVGRDVLYSLIYWGALDVDLMRPLNHETMVGLPAATAAREEL